MQANLAAAESPAAAGQVMNVAVGTARTLNELVAQLRELLGVDIEPEYAETRKGDVPESLADITQARELIGYDPQVSFEAGLRRTIDWIAEQRATRGAAPPG